MRELRGAEIALIPQEPMAAFSPVHTVGDQIIEAIMLHGRRWHPDGRPVRRQEARAITVDLFRDVGISMPEQRVDAYSWQLSGGLRQRAMIAMALSCKPRLLIADEPTTAIDVTTQAQILALLRELQRKYDTAIIFITHDLGVIAQMANYVVVMYLGRVMEEGPVDEIFHAPKHPYTQALLRSIPSMHGETRTALPIISGALPHPFNRPPAVRSIRAAPTRCRTAARSRCRGCSRSGRSPIGRVASCITIRPNRHDAGGRDATARGSRPAQVFSRLRRDVPPRRRPRARRGRRQLHREGRRNARPGGRKRLRQDDSLALHPARDRSDRRAGAVSHAGRQGGRSGADVAQPNWRRCAAKSR